LKQTSLPLPSARLHLEGSAWQPLYDQVLATEGMEMRQLRVKYPRDSFFSKGERTAIVKPMDFAYEAGDDDLYPGKRRFSMRFVLPRGAYATILLKRLFGESGTDFARLE
jgi:tRNA pseudouridine13 synthase